MVHHELVKAMKAFMYNHPIRGGRRLHLVVMLSLVVALFSILLLVPRMSVTNVSVAQGGLKVVSGTVTDGSGVVNGASVTITMWNGAIMDSQQSTTTDSAGFYAVTFGGFSGFAWTIGDTITVDVTKGSESGSASAIATDDLIEPSQTIDVFIGPAVPEFGSLVGVTLAMLGIVFAVSKARRA